VAISGHQIKALFDPGAGVTVMGPRGRLLADKIGTPLSQTTCQSVRVADGRTDPVLGYAELPFELGSLRKKVRVAILGDLHAADCYVGTNFIRAFQAVLDPTTDQVLLKETNETIPLEVAGISFSRESEVGAIGLAIATPAQHEVVQQLLQKVLGPATTQIGCTSWIKHDIELTSTPPVKQRYYPVSKARELEMKRQVDEMLAAGIIEPSTSGWSSPVVMVQKENGKLRFCVDYRRVNAVTKIDAYPLPRMDHILRKLKDAQYISTLDISSAYHQIPLTDRAREVTAFTVPERGLFQFTRMPFGLCNAGATFQRLIDKVISGELESRAFAYLDDVIVASSTFEEHIETLERLFKRLKEAGLMINREKSVFCREEVNTSAY